MTTKTSRKPTAKPYTIADLKNRQDREGYSFGYLGHGVRRAGSAAKADAAVMKFLTTNGFDAVDAYHALNSRCARHMGDALQDLLEFTLADEARVQEDIALNLGWKTPAQMYASFGETRTQLEKGAR
jgi:hypothetical protein